MSLIITIWTGVIIIINKPSSEVKML